MKKQILRISILPLIIVTVLSFTELQPQKDNQGGNKGNKEQGKDGQGDKGNKGNDQPQQRKGNSDPQQGNKNSQGKDQDKKNDDRGQDMDKRNNNANRGQGKNDDQDINGRSDRQNKGNDKLKGEKRNEKIGGWRSEDIEWEMTNADSRKRARNQKKVSICHHTSGDGFPVNISVSENALQAHMNHGDEMGSCSGDYRDRWTPDYIQTRENVYNIYEQTWENMSYGEALVRYAADKLLGIRSDLDLRRSTLSVQEVQRREGLILDLQNNVNSLENQLGQTRQRVDNVNIIVQL